MKFLLLPFLALACYHLPAQNIDTIQVSRTIPRDQILTSLQWLASDQRKGRHIGLKQIDTVAYYIANQFKKAGARPLGGATGYFQEFNVLFNRSGRIDPQVASNLPLYAASRGVDLKNVIGFIPGTDKNLSKQCIVLSAHYDHVGYGSTAVMEEGKMDSIYNGARDNATGTAAVIAAAKYFGRFPPKRSVLFICYTAEEEGLIGSRYYADHPVIPLNQTVYNLNIDNASYNTTKAVCLFDLYRTNNDTLIIKASKAYHLNVLPDPVGNLFDRSDNLSLAQKGIPALTYSMGITAWDSTITNRYHRLSDEVGNMDLDYVVKFTRAYILSAECIANDPVQPKWINDDLYEKEWQALFGKKEE